MIRNCFSKSTIIFFGKAAAIAALVVAAEASRSLAVTPPAAFGDWQAYDYGILMESGSTLTMSGTGDKILGNIGMGGTGDTLNLSGATSPVITGHGNGDYPASTSAVLGFAAASGSSTYDAPGVTTGITTGTSPVQLGSGSTPTYSVANLANTTGLPLNVMNSISSTDVPANVTVTGSVNITPGGVLTLPAGNGPFVYTATVAAGFNTSGASYAGNFTVQGTANQQVVIDITSNSPVIDGSLGLAGHIGPPNVIYNFTGTGGFTLDSFGHFTSGMFIDQTGPFNVTNSEIQGILVGGGSSTFATSTIFSTPEPGSFAIAAVGIFALVGWRLCNCEKGSWPEHHRPVIWRAPRETSCSILLIPRAIGLAADIVPTKPLT